MAITHKARKLSKARLQGQCNEWNNRNPIGRSVVLKLDGSDEPIETKTRSAAVVLSGHSPVIWLEGISGCYLLTHVRAFRNDNEKQEAIADLKRKLVV